MGKMVGTSAVSGNELFTVSMHPGWSRPGYGGDVSIQHTHDVPTPKEHSMTDTNEAVITEALAVIDKALAEMLRRELVSSGEVADLLLDVRTLLTHPAPVAAI